MARKTHNSTSPAPPPPAESPPPLPSRDWRGPAALAAAGLYLLTALLIVLASPGGRVSVGDLCGDSCSPVTFLGQPLAYYGIAVIAAVIILLAIGMRPGRRVYTRVAAHVSLLLASSSMAFAATQWMGLHPLCPICQAASLMAFATCCIAWPHGGFSIRGSWLMPIQTVVIGVLAVAAAWPHLRGEHFSSAAAARETGFHPIVYTEAAPAGRPNAPGIGDLAASLSIGSPDAPYELVVLSDFDCKVCERFETQTLPVLIERGVNPGRIRIRFVMKAGATTREADYYKLVAATMLTRAGGDVAKIFSVLRTEAIVSVPRGVALYPDAAVREKAMEELRLASSGDLWPDVAAEHRRVSMLLRRGYFDSSGATPLFVMFPGRLDTNNLPPADELYVFRGFQKPQPFLEFAGVIPPAMPHTDDE